MGIQVEFNPDLCLRNIDEFKKGNRKKEECLPENMKVGESYVFLKKDQRNYYLLGEIPLIETKGEGNLSKPIGSIQIISASHFLMEGTNEIWTTGEYKIIEIFKEGEIRFNGFEKLD